MHERRQWEALCHRQRFFYDKWMQAEPLCERVALEGVFTVQKVAQLQENAELSHDHGKDILRVFTEPVLFCHLREYVFGLLGNNCVYKSKNVVVNFFVQK